MLRLTPFMTQRLEQAKSFAIEYGGSESNVAATLAQLGSKVHYVTRLPDQPFGHSALGCLAQHGVDISQSIFGGDRLGVYYVELGSGRRNSKVIYDRKNSGMHTLAPGMIPWEAIFQEVDWFHWSGITPSISSSAAAATKEAILAAKKLVSLYHAISIIAQNFGIMGLLLHWSCQLSSIYARWSSAMKMSWGSILA